MEWAGWGPSSEKTHIPSGRTTAFLRGHKSLESSVCSANINLYGEEPKELLCVLIQSSKQTPEGQGVSPWEQSGLCVPRAGNAG